MPKPEPTDLDAGTDTLGLQEYIGALARRKWYVLIVLLASVAGAALYVSQQPFVYQAEARFVLRQTRQARRGGEAPTASTFWMGGDYDPGWFQTELYALRGGAIQRDAAEKLPQELRGAPVTGVSVGTVQNTSIVTITVTSTVPRMAAALPNAMVETYIEQSKKRNRTSADSTLRYVQQLRSSAELELQQATDDLRAYKEQTGVFDVSTETQAGLQQVRSLEGDLEKATMRLQAIGEEIAHLQHQGRAAVPAIAGAAKELPDDIVEGLRGELVKLEAQRIELLNEYTENSEQVRMIDAQIARARERLRAEVQRVTATRVGGERPVAEDLNARYVTLASERVGTQAQMDALSQAIASAEGKLKTYPSREAEFVARQRKVDVAESAYLSLLNEEQRLKIQVESEVANAEPLSEAVTPTSPISPQPRQTLMTAVALGLFLGVVVALLVDRLDDTVRDPRELERLCQLPTLAAIPFARGEPPITIERAGERSAFANAISSLRSNIRFTSANGPVRLLMVASPGVAEGKSTVALNLAVSNASAGQRVILVDADMRRPSLARMLDLDGDTGLTNILVGDLSLDTVLHPTDTQNLEVLTTGPRPPSPAPLLESEAMGRLIEELKARTDLVVFDSPPTLVAADAQILGNLVDGVVLVVDANHTRKHDVVRAVETLRLGRAPLLGLALNMLRRRGGGYGYYYYYYYSHYDRYYHEDEPSKDV